MKIAIPTDGRNLKDEVVSHFGRAKNFLIFNTETENFKIYPNPETIGKTELPPEFLNNLGVKAVICFSLGPRALNLFKEFGIKTLKATKKSINENLKEFQKGSLRELEEKDIF